MAIKYATTLELGQALGIVKAVPSWDTGDIPDNESVSTGNSSNTQFFLNRKNIVADSYTLYADGVAMTEGSAGDYTLDKDSGEITLTSAGVTTLGVKDLTAKYKYFDIDMADSILNASLIRAEAEVDKRLNSTFSDGTATNPTYPLETEIQSSEGFFMDRIIADKKPLKDIETTLNGAHTDSITTISLAAGTGSDYPSTGTIIINSEAISYTGVSTDDLTGCTRGVLGSTAATHADGDSVHSTILFRSDTVEGSAVVWTIQPWDLSMYANAEGLLYKFKDVDPDPLTRRGVANRVKIIYYYGHDSIPADITRLTIVLAKRMLIQDNIGKAIIAGRDEFSPEMFNVDSDEISKIIGSYIVLPMGNT
ncbi:MAG: hypothetical protein ACTSRU_10605 [Candidatus Hodarchaeales archaeon]